MSSSRMSLFVFQPVTTTSSSQSGLTMSPIIPSGTVTRCSLPCRSLGMYLFQQISQLLRDLEGWITGQRDGDQTLSLAHLSAIEGKRRRTPAQHRPCRLRGRVERSRRRCLTLTLKRLAKQVNSPAVVAEPSGGEGLVGKVHRLPVLFSKEAHLFAT